MQLQPEFPARPAFVTPPYQYGIAGNLVGKIDEPQLLSHLESLRYHGKAALRSNIDRVTFRTQALPLVGPPDRHRHARIEPPAAADVPQPGLKTHIPRERHGNLLSTGVQGQRSRWALHSLAGS